jgi:hypothetical protein
MVEKITTTIVKAIATTPIAPTELGTAVGGRVNPKIADPNRQGINHLAIFQFRLISLSEYQE